MLPFWKCFHSTAHCELNTWCQRWRSAMDVSQIMWRDPKCTQCKSSSKRPRDNSRKILLTSAWQKNIQLFSIKFQEIVSIWKQADQLFICCSESLVSIQQELQLNAGRGRGVQLRNLDAMCIRDKIFQGEKAPRPRWIFVSFLVIHSLQEWECRFAEKGWAWEYVEEDSLDSLDVLT